MGLPDHLCSRYLGPVLFSLQQQIYMGFLYIYIKIYKGTSLRETVCWDGQTQCCVMSVCALVLRALWWDAGKMVVASPSPCIRQKRVYS